jgi:hypothetical protein
MTLDEQIAREREHNQRLALEIAHEKDRRGAPLPVAVGRSVFAGLLRQGDPWHDESAGDPVPSHGTSKETAVLRELKRQKRASDRRLAALEHRGVGRRMTLEGRIEKEQEKNDTLRLQIEDVKSKGLSLWPTPSGGGS